MLLWHCIYVPRMACFKCKERHSTRARPKPNVLQLYFHFLQCVWGCADYAVLTLWVKYISVLQLLHLCARVGLRCLQVAGVSRQASRAAIRPEKPSNRPPMLLQRGANRSHTHIRICKTANAASRLHSDHRISNAPGIQKSMRKLREEGIPWVSMGHKRPCAGPERE